METNHMPDKEEPRVHYTWVELDEDIVRILDWVDKAGTPRTFQNIYGIPRGGLIPAVLLSYHLDTPLIQDANQIGEHTLVIDDLVDTGKTLARLRQKVSAEFTLATLFWNPKAPEPDFYCRKRPSWVIFPWETEKTSKYDDTEF